MAAKVVNLSLDSINSKLFHINIQDNIHYQLSKIKLVTGNVNCQAKSRTSPSKSPYGYQQPHNVSNPMASCADANPFMCTTNSYIYSTINKLYTNYIV